MTRKGSVNRECACGCGRAGRGMYFSNACKQRAYRKRALARDLHTSKIVASTLEDQLHEDDFHLVCKLLNTVANRRQARAVDEALRIIINSYNRKIDLAKRSSSGRRHAITS